MDDSSWSELLPSSQRAGSGAGSFILDDTSLKEFLEIASSSHPNPDFSSPARPSSPDSALRLAVASAAAGQHSHSFSFDSQDMDSLVGLPPPMSLHSDLMPPPPPPPPAQHPAAAAAAIPSRPVVISISPKQLLDGPSRRLPPAPSFWHDTPLTHMSIDRPLGNTEVIPGRVYVHHLLETKPRNFAPQNGVQLPLWYAALFWPGDGLRSFLINEMPNMSPFIDYELVPANPGLFAISNDPDYLNHSLVPCHQQTRIGQGLTYSLLLGYLDSAPHLPDFTALSDTIKTLIQRPDLFRELFRLRPQSSDEFSWDWVGKQVVPVGPLVACVSAQHPGAPFLDLLCHILYGLDIPELADTLKICRYISQPALIRNATASPMLRNTFLRDLTESPVPHYLYYQDVINYQALERLIRDRNLRNDRAPATVQNASGILGTIPDQAFWFACKTMFKGLAERCAKTGSAKFNASQPQTTDLYQLMNRQVLETLVAQGICVRSTEEGEEAGTYIFCFTNWCIGIIQNILASYMQYAHTISPPLDLRVYLNDLEGVYQVLANTHVMLLDTPCSGTDLALLHRDAIYVVIPGKATVAQDLEAINYDNLPPHKLPIVLFEDVHRMTVAEACAALRMICIRPIRNRFDPSAAPGGAHQPVQRAHSFVHFPMPKLVLAGDFSAIPIFRDGRVFATFASVVLGIGIPLGTLVGRRPELAFARLSRPKREMATHYLTLERERFRSRILNQLNKTAPNPSSGLFIKKSAIEVALDQPSDQVFSFQPLERTQFPDVHARNIISYIERVRVARPDQTLVPSRLLTVIGLDMLYFFMSCSRKRVVVALDRGDTAEQVYERIKTMPVAVAMNVVGYTPSNTTVTAAAATPATRQ